MPSSHSKPQFALSTLPLNKSNSNYRFAAIALQRSDSKEFEQSEQFRPISPKFDNKSTNSHNTTKLGEKLINSNYKYQALETN